MNPTKLLFILPLAIALSACSDGRGMSHEEYMRRVAYCESRNMTASAHFLTLSRKPYQINCKSNNGLVFPSKDPQQKGDG